MKWTNSLLAALLLAGWTLPAQAQFFLRRPRPQNLQVPELIALAKDGDEHKRLMAIEQLREFDPNSSPQIVPLLIDILLSDPKSGIRMEALHSLTRIRPANPEIGQALQQAAQHDESIRIRWQARSSLWMHGNFSVKDNQFVPPQAPTAKEPPLLNSPNVIVGPAAPLPGQPIVPAAAPPAVAPKYVPAGTTPDAPRPLTPASTVSMPRPLPSGPMGFSTAIPQPAKPAPAVPPAAPPTNEDGPMIIPAP